MAGLYSRVGHFLRESLLQADRLAQGPRGARRSVVFFPSDWAAGLSGDLRAVAVAKALRPLGQG